MLIFLLMVVCCYLTFINGQSICAPGRYFDIISGICIVCPSGKYCAGGTDPAKECDPGYYCSQGSYIQTMCAYGTYNPSTNQTVCQTIPSGNFDDFLEEKNWGTQYYSYFYFQP